MNKPTDLVTVTLTRAQAETVAGALLDLTANVANVQRGSWADHLRLARVRIREALR